MQTKPHPKKAAAALLICFFSIYYLPAAAGRFDVLSAFLKNDALQHAAISIKAVNVTDGKTIAAFNENTALTPASNMKIITTATALIRYGSNHRYRTPLLYSGTIKDSVLHGNLYIQSSGDPTLGSRYINRSKEHFLHRYLHHIRKAGISSIEGDIITLDSLFRDEGVSGKWLIEDAGTDYGQGVYSISIFDNIYKTPLPSDTTSATVIDNPGLYLAQYLKLWLHRHSIPVSGKATTLRTERQQTHGFNIPQDLTETGAAYSPPLSEIIRETNVRSNNHYAEHLYRKLQSDSVNIRLLWQRHGLDSTALIMYDGSGLSPQNAASASYLTDLLVYMYTHHGKHQGAFYRSLPLAGKEGTVATFLKDTPLSGKAHLKSGAISNVQAYSGYIEKENQYYAFSIIINSFSGKRKDLRKAIERLLTDLFNPE
ncbi:MAG: D-alanyl-D-alanine carboxypeptidase [Dysgonamonadaceae bacterium]|jgi:D-alanyl-D-alanine carboxypeptidase/D-alanyl-D-alanine-endopeptidase (penicillin-binding protein 4)|nr:D-alanyl-D-alanine carboxypeptidase [Dysgonamonadaceae bacterium]